MAKTAFRLGGAQKCEVGNGNYLQRRKAEQIVESNWCNSLQEMLSQNQARRARTCKATDTDLALRDMFGLSFPACGIASLDNKFSRKSR